jgi:mono/diheme cytochrome c family protein
MRKSSIVFCAVWLALTATGKPEALASSSSPPEEAKRGQDLFLRNCAHCHGNDAHGDEGPDLHGLKKSDARISKIITQGIKGEMPAFGSKLNDADVKALIAFLRTLKD